MVASGQMCVTNESGAMNLLQTIKKAFSNRKPPILMTLPCHSDTDIYTDAQHFSGRRWEELKCNELEKYHAALFGFSGESFCYFLPGIMSASIIEDNPHLIMIDAIISELDRLPQTGMTDEELLTRWMRLSADECRATQEWIVWLSEKLQDDGQDPLLRAYEGLDILISAATPSAP
jgi:hypothetical protein